MASYYAVNPWPVPSLEFFAAPFGGPKSVELTQKDAERFEPRLDGQHVHGSSPAMRRSPQGAGFERRGLNRSEPKLVSALPA